ncbi:MAG: hypothetical protein ACXVEF_25600 [Polyangiales bacterium]
MPHASWSQIVILSAIVMGLSHTIAKERIFRAFRERLGGRETFCGYLVSCPYCNSHWLAFALVPLTDTYVIDVTWNLGPFTGLLRWFLSAIFVTVLAAFMRIGFYFIDESQGLVRREIAKTEAEAKAAAREAEDVGGEHPSLPH